MDLEGATQIKRNRKHEETPRSSNYLAIKVIKEKVSGEESAKSHHQREV